MILKLQSRLCNAPSSTTGVRSLTEVSLQSKHSNAVKVETGDRSTRSRIELQSRLRNAVSAESGERSATKVPLQLRLRNDFNDVSGDRTVMEVPLQSKHCNVVSAARGVRSITQVLQQLRLRSVVMAASGARSLTRVLMHTISRRLGRAIRGMRSSTGTNPRCARSGWARSLLITSTMPGSLCAMQLVGGPPGMPKHACQHTQWQKSNASLFPLKSIWVTLGHLASRPAGSCSMWIPLWFRGRARFRTSSLVAMQSTMSLKYLHEARMADLSACKTKTICSS